MKWSDIFKKYNLQMLRNNKVVNIFMVISVMVAVSISLAIPQIETGLDEYWSGNAAVVNGADLKVEASYSSDEFDKKMKELRKSMNVTEASVSNSTISKGNKEIYADLLAGDFELDSKQAIISNNLATLLNVSEGDSIKVGTGEYIIKGIEKFASGVNKQAEEMGYIKIAASQDENTHAFCRLYFINGSNCEEVRENLTEIAPNYRYTSIQDVKEKFEEQNSTNIMSLNMLNTISIVMTVLSIVSGMILIISGSRRDIAVMRLEAIEVATIKKAFQAQFALLILPSIPAGAIVSFFVAKVILSGNGIDYSLTPNIMVKLVLGIVLFAFIYSVYIKISCAMIKQINPMTVLRAAQDKIKKGKTVRKGILFTLFVLIIYSFYVGSDNILAGSIIILLLFMIFYAVVFVLLNIITGIKPGKGIYKYTIANIKENRNSTILIILSLSFTILFFLVGFSLGKIIADNYNLGLDNKIEYNYMLSTGNEEEIKRVLKQNAETGYYTKLNLYDGIIYGKDNEKNKVVLCGIEEEEYGIKYHSVEGTELFASGTEGILVSAELARSLNLNIGNKLVVEISECVAEYTIKGIYDSGGMNSNHILMPEHEVNADKKGFMYLARIDAVETLDMLENVQIVNIQNIGNALEDAMQDFFGIFRSICIICIVSSVIFNINLLYVDTLEKRKNHVIMRAIGLGKNNLYKSLLYQSVIVLILTLALSVGTFCLPIHFVMYMLFGVSNSISAGMMIVPILLALLLIVIIFMVPFNGIRKMYGYEELRELV